MKSWSWQQNKMEPCSGVPLSDRGFRYGQHFFETLAVRGGRLLFVEEHWKRLITAAQRHHFPVNASWHQGVLPWLQQMSCDDGIVRIYLTAGEGAVGSPIVVPQLFVLWEKSHFPSQHDLEKGVALVSLDQPVGTSSWGEKTGNYWEHLNALQAARQAGAEEGLVFDRDDYLISAAMANVVIWLSDGAQIRAITPLPSQGAREGVVSSWISQYVTPLHQRPIKRWELLEARAMAITNSRLGVMPVATLDRRRFPDFSLALHVAQAYEAEIISLA